MYLFGIVLRVKVLSRFGGDLLSHVLRRSTIGATALNGRVRDGIGCFARAIATKPKKRQGRAVMRLPEHQYAGIRCHRIRGLFQSWLLSQRCLLLTGHFGFKATLQERDVLMQVLLLLDQIKPIEQLVPVS